MARFFYGIVFLTLGASMQSHAQTNVVVDATEYQSVGGVGTLDRAKYFNHWGHHVIEGETNLGNLQREVWAKDGLRSVTGRDTYEFDSMLATSVPEDPDRPGYFDLDALRAKFRDGEYHDFVVYGPRYESLREHDNPILVQSGRADGNWPDWLKDGTHMPMSQGGKAYAEFLNMYLEEVVYGDKPGQGYMPVPADRFYIEIMNEPQLELEGTSWEEIYTFHKNVTIDVKSKFPQARLGGIANGEAPFPDWNPHRWQPVKDLMDDMATWRDADGNPVAFDFWTLHPYDVFRSLEEDGSREHQVRQSPGHNNGILDLFETYSNIKFGEPKRFALTEYGSFIHNIGRPTGDYGSYYTRQRQWDKMVAVKEKLMVYLQRPDRIINATPFVPIQHWAEGTPTPEGGNNYVMWERDANGDWMETIVGSMYRMYNDVDGNYVAVASDNPDVQVAGFINGSELNILLNNVSKKDQPVNLQAIVGSAQVQKASLTRVYWNGEKGIYDGDIDLADGWQELTLSPEEGAVLQLTLSGPPAVARKTDVRTYYGDKVQAPIEGPDSRSEIVTIDADLTGAVSANLRIGIAEREAIWDEAFKIGVNGKAINVPATGSTGYDDDDMWLFTREVDVPLDYLKQGRNRVLVQFDSNGGQLVTATLLVRHAVGDAPAQ